VRRKPSKPEPRPIATELGSRLPAVLLLLVALLVGTIGGALPANADDEQKPMATRRLFDEARPGVELITATFTGNLSVPAPQLTAANQRALQLLVLDKIRRGEVPANATAARNAVIAEIARDPFRWYTPSDRVDRMDLKVLAMGSGFSISANGYIVTNAHVVAPSRDALKATFLREGAGDSFQDSIQNLVSGGVPQSLATRLLDASLRWATKNSKLSNFKRRLETVTSSGSGGVVYSVENGRPAKLVTAGKEIPGKDVAIIKVDATNMATVLLGDDTTLSTGDRLFVLGFPGPATFSPVLSKESEKEPTLTQGVLSAKKTASEGFPVLQTDATMTHGNSGGPVFDEHGKVVGVATFGSVDPQTGREVAGLNFAVPVSVVNELLSRAKVKPVEGVATEKYRLALDAFERHWYKRALPLFKEVKRLDPAHPTVGKLIKDSEKAIAQGRDQTPREILGLPLTYFAALVVVGLLAVAVLVTARARRRRRRRRQRERLGGAVADTLWGEPGSAPGSAWAPAPDPATATGWAPAPDPATATGWAPAPPLYPQGAQDPASGSHAPVEPSEWWSAEPYAPVGFRAGGNGSPVPTTAAGQPAQAPQAPQAPRPPQAPAPEPEPWWPAEDQTAELPVVDDEAEPMPATTEVPRPRHDWWQRERTTEEPAPPAPAEIPTPAAPPAAPAYPRRPASPRAAAVACWNCGYPCPPTNRFCEQCWSLLES
jgi:serine protease Do